MEISSSFGWYVKCMETQMQSSKKNKKVKEDDKFSFHNKSIAQRSTILFAGPAANFIFSFFVLVFINCYFGFNITKPIVSEVELNSPAYDAGLKEGDIILEVNNEKVLDFSKLRDIISSSDSDTLKILYSRNNKIDVLETRVVNKKIGIRGTVESVKLNIVESIFNQHIKYFIL